MVAFQQEIVKLGKSCLLIIEITNGCRDTICLVNICGEYKSPAYITGAPPYRTLHHNVNMQRPKNMAVP